MVVGGGRAATRREAARHEAGHAVATMALGGVVLVADVWPEGHEWDGRIVGELPMEDARDFGFRAMVAAVAGSVADRRRKIGAVDAAYYCAAADVGGWDRGEHYLSARRAARWILAQNRAAHAALTAALEERQLVLNADVERVVFEHAPGMRGRPRPRRVLALWRLAEAALKLADARGVAALAALAASAHDQAGMRTMENGGPA